MSELRSRFDWYELTFEGWDDAASTLSVVLGGQLRHGKGRNGYAECVEVLRGEDELVRVYSRSARIGEVHLVISGAACDEVVPIVRHLWGTHRVSRADSAVDLEASFDELDEHAVQLARQRGLTHRLIVDSDGGATRYLGAPSSEARVRVYKKSEQLLALHPDRAASIPRGIVRVELQLRPGKREAKEHAAELSADELWGMSRWAADLAQELVEIDAPRVVTHFWRPSDRSRALHYVGVQYGPLMRAWAAEVGREAVLAELGGIFQL